MKNTETTLKPILAALAIGAPATGAANDQVIFEDPKYGRKQI